MSTRWPTPWTRWRRRRESGNVARPYPSPAGAGRRGGALARTPRLRRSWPSGIARRVCGRLLRFERLSRAQRASRRAGGSARRPRALGCRVRCIEARHRFSSRPCRTGAGTGAVEGHGRRDLLSDGLRGQPRSPERPRGSWRTRVLGRVEPRQHHRRLSALRRFGRGLSPPRSGSCTTSPCSGSASRARRSSTTCR